MEPRRRQASRRLSYVLRHRPDSIGLVLQPGGWVDIADLLTGLAEADQPLTRSELLDLVATDDKSRYSLDPPDQPVRIRAAQGHSVDVDLHLAPAEPPPVLLHGTTAAALTGIRTHGLLPGQRQMVHLSTDAATARTVGARRGTPLLVTVDAAAAHRDGHVFFRADNGIWLTAAVPARYLSLPQAP